MRRTPLLLSLLLTGSLACNSVSVYETGAAGAAPTARHQAPRADSLDAALDRADASIAGIAAIPDAQRDWENTVGAIDALLTQLTLDTQWDMFMANVHPDADVRARGEEARQAIMDWYVDFGKNVDLYRAVKAYADTRPQLEGERARMLEHLLRDYRRAGMDLPADKRDELAELEKELSKLELEFSTNIREDDTKILFTREELRGCPDEFLAGLPRNGDLYVVDMAYPTTRPIRTYCEVEATRQKLAFAVSRRAGLRNVELLEEIIQLRDRQATLLGYDSTVDYVTEPRMAGNAETVAAFYADLRPKLREKARLDKAEFQAAKREHTGDPDAELFAWDRSYYENWLLKNRYAVDSEKVREYFPLRPTLEGLFEITQTLYGIEYREATGTGAAKGRAVWHEDVTLWEVYDKASGELLGEFYLDLHPRDGKYRHAAKFGIHPRKKWADGSLTKPVCALVCNFTKPTADKPALMTHGEVETMFHEFGHCLHSVLTEADTNMFEGTTVARDFVEAPSQMFEEWVWHPSTLALFAKHYETGAPLPADLLDGMIAARHLGSGMNAESQVWLGYMDYSFHMADGGEIDTVACCHDTYGDCTLFEPLGDTYFHAAFGHLVGYEAGYYGYLWSLVYAADIASRFKEEGMLNTDLGMEWRKKVLAKGGTVDELDMVRDFLGREPSPDAFLAHLGLSSE